MSNKRIVASFEVVASGKNISVVAKDTARLGEEVEKTAQNTKKAGKTAKDYDKQNKALFQSNLSSAKSFSKMNQTIGSGSSGLVGAYATLAANVFAATAAFNALRSAAQVETLAKGFDFLAAQVGRTGSVITDKLREITNQALSFEDATRASAVALTAGFSTESIERLGQVARNASISLGRNLGDSIDRLFRGVAKLEPEILDELGILVRLDTATENYAASLGKAASELSDFERRQAFLNAAIEQGELKYGRIADQIDPNPYDQLAASFADLTKQLIGFANVAITPLIKLLTANSAILLGTLVAFASTIVGQMFPALTQLGDKSLEAAEKAKIAASKQEESSNRIIQARKKTVIASNLGGAGVKQLRNQLAQNTQIKNYDKALGSLSKSEKLRERNLTNFSGKELKRKERELEAIRKLKREVEELKAAEAGRAASQQKAMIANRAAREEGQLSKGVVAIGATGGLGGFKEANKAFGKLRGEVNLTERKLGNLTGKGNQRRFKDFGTQVKVGSKLAAGGIRLFGAALVNAIPLAGQIIFIGGLLVEFLINVFRSSKDADSGIQKLQTTVKEFDDNLKDFNIGVKETAQLLRNQKDGFDAITETLFELRQNTTFAAGAFDELTAAVNAAINELGQEKKISKFELGMKRVSMVIKELYDAGFIIPTGVKTVFDGIGSFIGDSIEAIGNFGKATVDFFFKPTEKFVETINESDVTKIFEEAAEGIRQIKEEAEIGAIVVNDFFGPNSGFTEYIQLLIDSGVKSSEVLRVIESIVNQLNSGVQGAEGEIQSFGKGLLQTDKVFSEFLNRLKKKNEFTVLADQVDSIVNSFVNLSTQLGEEKAIEQLLGEISDKEIATLAKFGITTKNLFEEIDDGAGGTTTRIEALAKQFRELSDEANKLAEEKKLSSALISAAKSAAQAEGALFTLNQKLETLRKRGTFTLTGEQAVENAKKQAELTINAAREELKLKLEILGLEKKIAIEKINANKNLDPDERVRLIQLQEELLLAQTQSARNALSRTITGARSTMFGAFATAEQTGTTIDRIGAAAGRGVFEKRQEATFDATTGNLLTEAVGGSAQEKLKATEGILNPMIEQLKGLGPEGEFVAAATTGILGIADAFNIMSMEGLKSAEGLQAVGNILAQVSMVLQASTRQQVAEIDNQIAAEKKRDGKSAESLNKIRAMEAKKDAIARKSFETNKKLQMAQTVVNTSAAIVQALASAPPPFNIALSAMMAALGAAQLAIIAKTKYQSTSSNIETPQTNLNIGNRGSAVDVSQRATASELAYLRGGRTTGQDIGGAGASFPGGAMGRKSYSDGGIVVGERGPEIVSASSDIDVTPNYALGGGTMNVNFSISALDSAGVEDVLMNQQGNIIKMIRQAANQNGENFLENVDTMAYGSSGGDT
jgi:hypothetical protein